MARLPGQPPWWRWFEPPPWFPKWLHLLTCTYCHGLRRYGCELKRGPVS